MSSQNWKLEAILEGQGFYGPPLINVRLGETALYPLMFKPIAECITTVRGKSVSRFEKDASVNKISISIQIMKVLKHLLALGICLRVKNWKIAY